METENGHMGVSVKCLILCLCVNGKREQGSKWAGQADSSHWERVGANERFNDCSKIPLTRGNGRNPLKAEAIDSHIYMNVVAQSASPLLLWLDDGGNNA